MLVLLSVVIAELPSAPADVLLEEIEDAGRRLDSEALFAGCRSFLERFPEHARVDEIRYELALGLVADSLTSGDSARLDEGLVLLQVQAERCRSEDCRMEAEFVLLRFESREQGRLRARTMLERYAHRPERREALKWLLGQALIDRDIRSAGQYADEILKSWPRDPERARLTDLARRGRWQGRTLPWPNDAPPIAGKVVLVDFWAPWCAPCLRAFPQLSELKKRYEKDGLLIVSVRIDAPKPGEPPSPAFSWPSWLGPSAVEFSRMLGVTQLPAYYLLDRKGRLSSSELRQADLEAAIRAELAF